MSALPAWAAFPLPHLHSVALAVAIRGGPRYEGRGEQGRTHFMEHMVFRGAGRHDSLAEVMSAFERVGAEPEAYTSEDSITLLLELDPARVREGLELLADILLRPTWRDLESERAVILEERLERVDESGTPCDLDDIGLALAFPGHPAGRSILGRRRDIDAVKREDLEAWRAKIVTRAN
ncbi:MAG: insulinase family protein, partial [Planctomycetes bacterium]|nr:insulinase family protein [Planctomycetota bacterium]